MISMLLIIICIISLTRMHPVALTLALACSSHKVLCDGLDGVWYYLSAGVFDVLVIGIIAVFIRPSTMAKSILWICMASLLLNFYGWLIWFLYLSPETYNMAFTILYCLAILFLLRKDSAKDESNNLVRLKLGVFPAARCERFTIRSTLRSQRKES